MLSSEWAKCSYLIRRLTIATVSVQMTTTPMSCDAFLDFWPQFYLCNGWIKARHFKFGVRIGVDKYEPMHDRPPTKEARSRVIWLFIFMSKAIDGSRLRLRVYNLAAPRGKSIRYVADFRHIFGPLYETWRHPQNWKYITYCIVVRIGPSHGHRSYVQQSSRGLDVWFLRYTYRQTDRPIHRHWDTLIAMNDNILETIKDRHIVTVED